MCHHSESENLVQACNQILGVILSREILHRVICTHAIQEALPYIDKILYITPQPADFVKKMYDIPDHAMESSLPWAGWFSKRKSGFGSAIEFDRIQAWHKGTYYLRIPAR